jgi:hypothetical protein
MATYYQRNKERLLEYQKKYNAEHKEEINQYFKNYYENNKFFFILKSKEYQEKLKPERVARREARKAKKAQKIQETLDKEFEEIKENIYWELVEVKEKEEVVVVPFQGIKLTPSGFVLEW